MNGQSMFPTATRGVFQDIFNGIGDAIGGVVGGIVTPIGNALGGVLGQAPSGLIQIGPGATAVTPQQPLITRLDEPSMWDRFVTWVTDSYGWAWLAGGAIVLGMVLYLIFRKPKRQFRFYRRKR